MLIVLESCTIWQGTPHLLQFAQETDPLNAYGILWAWRPQRLFQRKENGRRQEKLNKFQQLHVKFDKAKFENQNAVQDKGSSGSSSDGKKVKM